MTVVHQVGGCVLGADAQVAEVARDLEVRFVYAVVTSPFGFKLNIDGEGQPVVGFELAPEVDFAVGLDIHHTFPVRVVVDVGHA